MSQTLMVSESQFNKLAALDAEVLCALQLHSINREAKTMRWGVDLIKVYAQIPQFELVWIDELAPPVRIKNAAPGRRQSAQWKREVAQSRRAPN